MGQVCCHYKQSDMEGQGMGTGSQTVASVFCWQG